MNILRVATAAALLATGASASAANLVPNGTFDTNLNGWTVAASGATFSGQAALLDQSNDLLSITLTNLVSNTSYTFDYDYTLVSAPGRAPNPAVINWSLSNATSQTGVAQSNFAGYQFTALSNTLVITFSGTGSGNKSGLIDNVSLTGQVAAVPEPETYAMLLAGLGIVGFVSRRRRVG